MNRDFPDRSYFFDDGIRFACQRCGACCTGEPGIVRVSPKEAFAMADMLGVDLPVFRQQALYRLGEAWGVREEEDGRCVLFGAGGCRVYPVRPVQCRTFPFWPENMRSRYRWRQVRAACPGIGKGPLVDKEAILTMLGQGMPGREAL